VTASVPFDLPADALVGRVAVVTGASRGLGAGLAARFGQWGLSLGLCARSVPDPPDGARAVCRSLDVADAAAVEAFTEVVTAELGPIDIWVNNAGVLAPMGPQRSHDPTEVDRALGVNVGGVANGTRSFTRAVRTRGDGGRCVLVNVTSGAARTVYEGWSLYGACKAAVDHFTEIVAAEEPGIACYALAPGQVDTDMQALIRTHDQATFPAVDRFRTIHAQGAWTSPTWVADHILGLLADTFRPGGVVVCVPDEPR